MFDLVIQGFIVLSLISFTVETLPDLTLQVRNEDMIESPNI